MLPEEYNQTNNLYQHVTQSNMKEQCSNRKTVDWNDKLCIEAPTLLIYLSFAQDQERCTSSGSEEKA